MKKHEIKNKPMKTGKELRIKYFLGCEDFTHNFRLQLVKMTNKVFREKTTVSFADLINRGF